MSDRGFKSHTKSEISDNLATLGVEMRILCYERVREKVKDKSAATVPPEKPSETKPNNSEN